MDFLSNAIISASSTSVLGALITSFNPADYQSRSVVKLYTTQDLFNSLGSMDPRGFKFEQPGVLYSDTTVIRVVTDSVFTYMEEECKGLGQRSLDITDLVLRGVDKNGFVIVNFENIQAASELDALEQKGIMIPFKHFKVSNSSFNIYASYKDVEGDGFKTFSLLNLEDGSMCKFYAMFPADVNMADFGTGLIPSAVTTVEETSYVIYEVNLGLSGFYANVGEAFLNFLAYNISFYNIGEKLIKEMQTVMPKVPPLPSEEQPVRTYRRPKVNVSIQHVYKDSRLRGVLGCMGDVDSLVTFLKDFPEAAISYQWLQKIYQSPWYIDGEGRMSEEECIYSACTNLLPICRQERLKYALELLTHRYYIYMLGIVNDTMGPILKGGGVSGESVKRVTF